METVATNWNTQELKKEIDVSKSSKNTCRNMSATHTQTEDLWRVTDAQQGHN